MALAMTNQTKFFGFSERQIRFMTELPKEYTYFHIQQKDESIKVFRIKEVVDQSSAEVWKGKLSLLTKVTWRIARTFPKVGRRNLYRVHYRCQHAANLKRKKSSAMLRSTKTTDCPATLEIIIRKELQNKSCTTYDPLDAKWPAVIILKGDHNHPIDAAAILKHRDLSDASKQKLKELFSKGYQPTAALNKLKEDYMIEYGENYYKISSDGYYVPTLSVVHHFYNKEMSAHTDKSSPPVDNSVPAEDKAIKSLQNVLDTYSKNTGGKAIFSRTADYQHYYVAICSPIMMRAHKMTQSSELVIVDSTGEIDKYKHKIYFFVIPTAAGGLPIGAIVTDTDNSMVFYEAVKGLKTILPQDSFGGKHYPSVFLINTDFKEREPLEEEFPQSRLLLSQYQLVKETWSWLSNKDHGIHVNDRQDLQSLFKDVVYANSKESALEKHYILCNSWATRKYQNFLHYYETLWDRNKEWATYAREDAITTGNTTTSHAEAVFRVLKDSILEKSMAQDLSHLVDSILTKLEKHFERRLIDFSNGKIKKSLPALSKKLDLNFEIQRIEGDTFFIYDPKKKSNYCVDVKNGICSCLCGQSGLSCRHAQFILKHHASFLSHLNADVSTSDSSTSPIREELFYVATGFKAQEGWFEPLARKNSLTTESNRSQSQTTSVTKNEMNQYDTDVEMIEDHDVSIDVSEDLKELDALFLGIRSAIEKNPKYFMPHLKEMLKNGKTVLKNNFLLASTLSNFGTHPKLNPLKTSHPPISIIPNPTKNYSEIGELVLQNNQRTKL